MAALLCVAIAIAAAALPLRASADESNALPIEVEVAGTIDAPVVTVRDVLLAFEGFSRWFPATSEFSVIGRPGPGAVLVYGVQALPWPVADRDYVVEYRWWEEEGVFVLRATALADAAPPSPDGMVRVERMQSEWRIVAVPEGTAVQYRYEGDAGGRLPGFVAQVGWRSSTPLVIDGLREEVARRMAAMAAALARTDPVVVTPGADTPEPVAASGASDTQDEPPGPR